MCGLNSAPSRRFSSAAPMWSTIRGVDHFRSARIISTASTQIPARRLFSASVSFLHGCVRCDVSIAVAIASTTWAS